MVWKCESGCVVTFDDMKNGLGNTQWVEVEEHENIHVFPNVGGLFRVLQ